LTQNENAQLIKIHRNQHGYVLTNTTHKTHYLFVE